MSIHARLSGVHDGFDSSFRYIDHLRSSMNRVKQAPLSFEICARRTRKFGQGGPAVLVVKGAHF